MRSDSGWLSMRVFSTVRIPRMSDSIPASVNEDIWAARGSHGQVRAGAWCSPSDLSGLSTPSVGPARTGHAPKVIKNPRWFRTRSSTRRCEVAPLGSGDITSRLPRTIPATFCTFLPKASCVSLLRSA
eukprot:2329515-Rhodomonas_salina.1